MGIQGITVFVLFSLHVFMFTNFVTGMFSWK